MKLKVFSLIVFCIFSFPSIAQYKLSGIVVFEKDSLPSAECTIYLNNGKQTAISDEKGKFVFEDLANGHYTIQAVSHDHKFSKHSATIDGANKYIVIVIDGYSKHLDEVVVTEKRTDFGFTRMGAVESVGIYEGKKTEVIIPDQLVANMATNNARQVFSRVAGLNIFENDGSGLQLSVGGRGLDPNRVSNFNVRQNGYDISADALGYPESYYTPPVEALGRIEVVRGAASLQYGTQFGGLINFVMKKPVADKKIQLVARQTLGTYGFYNTFTSASGTVGKLSYYTFFQYKKGDGWRPNSAFTNHTFYSNVNYQLTTKSKIGIDVTQMGYLAQQPGGLTDKMFLQNAQQSNRERNWFKVNWNLFALHFDHKFNKKNEFNLRVFGLLASRYTIGFRPNRVDLVDDNSARNLIKGEFKNWGAEARFLKHYQLLHMPSVMLLGARYYHGFNQSTQGTGSAGKDADFNYANGTNIIQNDYQFPNRNLSLFTENIFYLHDKFSITPGMRFEYINTNAAGYYLYSQQDNAGNVLYTNTTNETRNSVRHFVLGGVGVSYKPYKRLNLYSNISQNYRSVTFSDMQITNPSMVIDRNLKDESGYSFDAGFRSEKTTLYNYDVSFFYLNYNDRIGEVQFRDMNYQVKRLRENIGQAVVKGLESYGEADILRILRPKQENWSGVAFVNMAFISSQYVKSDITAVQGKQVEFVPKVNMKTGARLSYKKLKGSFQYSYLSDQFSDATNALDGGPSAIIGLIPAYAIMDVSVSYEFKWFKLEGSVNNLANAMYFTRRATGYPGPGILPSDGRTLYLTLQVKI